MARENLVRHRDLYCRAGHSLHVCCQSRACRLEKGQYWYFFLKGNLNWRFWKISILIKHYIDKDLTLVLKCIFQYIGKFQITYHMPHATYHMPRLCPNSWAKVLPVTHSALPGQLMCSLMFTWGDKIVRGITDLEIESLYLSYVVDCKLCANRMFRLEHVICLFWIVWMFSDQCWGVWGMTGRGEG